MPKKYEKWILAGGAIGGALVAAQAFSAVDSATDSNATLKQVSYGVLFGANVFAAALVLGFPLITPKG